MGRSPVDSAVPLAVEIEKPVPEAPLPNAVLSGAVPIGKTTEPTSLRRNQGLRRL